MADIFYPMESEFKKIEYDGAGAIAVQYEDTYIILNELINMMREKGLIPENQEDFSSKPGDSGGD